MRRGSGVFSMSLLWVVVMMLAFTVGCGGGGGEGDAGSSSSSAGHSDDGGDAAAAAVDPATAATISGSVVFSGTAPTMEPIDLASEAVCAAHAESNPVLSENVVVNANGTLKNVFVYVKEGITGDWPASKDPVVLDQVGCQYVPHVLGIQVGQPLLIKNSDDGVLHNIHALSETRNGFNFGMPKVMESTKSFKKAEVMVKIKCDVHGWMASYAGVLDHPFFAVTGDDGSYELPALPPGDYVIEAWHEEYGTQTQNVSVGASETKDVAFTYAAS